MAEMVLMPQMGVSEESAILAKYLVQVGDSVKEGQALFSLETGKSAFECLADKAGTILAFFASEGDEVTVGVPVLAIGEPGESVSAPDSAPAVAPSAVTEEVAVVSSNIMAEELKGAPQSTVSGELKISPRARMLAETTGVNPVGAVGSGPEGRIIERDVKALAASGITEVSNTNNATAKPEITMAQASTPAAEFEDKPLSRIRKVIAENMHKSLSEMAQLTLNRTFDATAIMAFRKQCKNAPEFGLDKVTLNDLILLAVARTLPEFPELNAYFLGDKMRFFSHVQLAIAVDTPRGLMVPVIAKADTLSLATLSQMVKTKAAQCRDGNIAPEELTGGSFTVSNLGAAGIESFTPVINPPQTAILGVNTITLRPREVNGNIEFYQAMGLSLTFDHRAVDGAPAAAFLKKLSERLENFALTLAL